MAASSATSRPMTLRMLEVLQTIATVVCLLGTVLCIVGVVYDLTTAWFGVDVTALPPQDALTAQTGAFASAQLHNARGSCHCWELRLAEDPAVYRLSWQVAQQAGLRDEVFLAEIAAHSAQPLRVWVTLEALRHPVRTVYGLEAGATALVRYGDVRAARIAQRDSDAYVTRLAWRWLLPFALATGALAYLGERMKAGARKAAPPDAPGT